MSNTETKFKVGDKVRFRQDGEIGEHNKAMVNEELIDKVLTVTGVSVYIHDGCYFVNQDSNKYPSVVSAVQIEPIPEPNPKFSGIKVGDWVEHLNGTHLLVIEIRSSPLDKDITPKFKCNNGNTYSAFDGSCICDDDKIVRILSPREVVIDFGSGIKGTVRKEKSGQSIWVHDNLGIIARIWFCTLDPQTRAKVEKLLKAQGESKCQ